MSFRDEQLIFYSVRDRVQRFRHLPGITDIFWGAVYRKGIALPLTGIRFNVLSKKPKSRLSASELIPSRIAGFQTDVTDFRFRRQLRQESPFHRVRPLLGGVQVQAGREAGDFHWGTIGACLEFKHRTYGITNHHVLSGEDGDSPDIFQPRYGLFGEKIGSGSGIQNRDLDFALFTLLQQPDAHQSFNGIAGTITGFARPSGLNTRILLKPGAATGLTRGIYDGRSLLHPWRITIRSDEPEGKPVSLPGDSGSCWLQAGPDGNHRLFALHTGGADSGRIAQATIYSSIHASIIKQISST